MDKRLAAIETIARASTDPIVVVRTFLSAKAPGDHVHAVRNMHGGYIERESGQPIAEHLARHAEQKP
jgi:hypothetical protein